MIPQKFIHLLSGGLDSVTMLHDLKSSGHSVHCLLFDYKQQHAQELQFAKQHCHDLGVLFTTVELPTLRGLTDENWIVPNRNAIMLNIAVNFAVHAGADTVSIGCNADDAEYFPDCRPAFIQSMNALVKIAGYSIEIIAPYIDWPKWKIGQTAQQMGIKPHSIWSCYRGGASQCGNCPACHKLKAALP